MRRILVTGGCGFIGSNFIRYWMDKYPKDLIINADALTYAARAKYLVEYKKRDNYVFELCDIRDRVQVARLLARHKPDHCFHFAAESHVCRSIAGPADFVMSNVVGTFHLLEELKNLWEGPMRGGWHRFHHVSTDEVFGELLPADEAFNETTPIRPRSPYAATKAASDHLVQVYKSTYAMDVVLTNCSNNFGPNQHEEKLLPKAILALLKGDTMTLYGDGSHRRDWLYVGDHCSAIDTVFHSGDAGERYCVGGDNEKSNHELVIELAQLMGRELAIEFTDDRPTDDARYAINTTKIRRLGWAPQTQRFNQHLLETVLYYQEQVEPSKRAIVTDPESSHSELPAHL